MTDHAHHSRAEAKVGSAEAPILPRTATARIDGNVRS